MECVDIGLRVGVAGLCVAFAFLILLIDKVCRSVNALHQRVIHVELMTGIRGDWCKCDRCGQDDA